MTKYKQVLVIVSLALVAAACGGTEQVGDATLGSGGGKGGGRLEDAFNKSPSPKASATKDTTTKGDGKKNDDPKEDPKEVEKVSVKFFITQAGFDPYVIKVFTGGIVVVENQDSQPRSVTADDGTFDSGLIQPGKTWRYDANTAGEFNFHDSTRPYVVGKMQVVAQ